MAGGASLTVRTFQGINKIRWIGHDSIECSVGGIDTYILLQSLYPILPRGSLYVFLSLFHGSRIKVNGSNPGIHTPLCQHQGNEAGSRTDVEYAAGMTQVCPCTEKHPVGAYFHGATVVADSELLECKIWIWHGCSY